jgi:hypothetical protein
VGRAAESAASVENGPSRRFQRLTISAAIGEQRTWLDVLLGLTR